MVTINTQSLTTLVTNISQTLTTLVVNNAQTLTTLVTSSAQSLTTLVTSNDLGDEFPISLMTRKSTHTTYDTIVSVQGLLDQ